MKQSNSDHLGSNILPMWTKEMFKIDGNNCICVLRIKTPLRRPHTRPFGVRNYANAECRSDIPTAGFRVFAAVFGYAIFRRSSTGT